MPTELKVIEITGRELNRLIEDHFAFRHPYDIAYAAKPIATADESRPPCPDTLEIFAGDWIHAALAPQVGDIRGGKMSGNVELLLRLMVRDGALEKGLYRVAI